MAIRDLVPDAYITTDVGQHQMWAAQYLRNSPRKWASSAGLGTMGYGMPAALGIQTALPNEKVVWIAGDASILMNIQELGTISQYKLPVKVVIVNNQWQGMVRQWQESFYEERYSATDMTPGMPDFIALAKSFGVITGFSDHTIETTTPSIAIACGARIIEKHITLDKGMDGPDHNFSLTPR